MTIRLTNAVLSSMMFKKMHPADTRSVNSTLYLKAIIRPSQVLTAHLHTNMYSQTTVLAKKNPSQKPEKPLTTAHLTLLLAHTPAMAAL
jgi:hypothetical protein